jgi:integrase
MCILSAHPEEGGTMMGPYIPKGRTVAKVAVPLPREHWTPKPRGGWRKYDMRSTGTRDPMTVKRMQQMVRELGPRGQRAWDLLEKLATREWSLMDLYERYQLHRGDVAAIRASLEDHALSSYHAAFLKSRRSADTAKHYGVYLAALEAAGITHTRHLTVAQLARWVDSLTGASGTRRKYAAGVSAFCTFLVRDGAIASNPMRDVAKPKKSAGRLSFLDEPGMLRLVNAMPSPYRELSAFIHGTSLDVSAALAVEVGTIDTKSWGFLHLRPKSQRRHSVLVAEWARPFVLELLRGKLPLARLGDGVDRFALSDAHRAACQALGITNYWLRDARHSWAVRWAKLGGSAAEGAEQMGHSDGGVLFLSVYGRYVPSLAERQAVEDRAKRDVG